MNTFMGRPVRISKPQPRIQCSPDFAKIQRPELVQSTNEWMTKFFGTTTLVPDGEVWEIMGNTLVMSQATFDKAIASLSA